MQFSPNPYPHGDAAQRRCQRYTRGTPTQYERASAARWRAERARPAIGLVPSMDCGARGAERSVRRGPRPKLAGVDNQCRSATRAAPTTMNAPP